MSQRIVIDPIIRIEGHLRIEVVVDDDVKPIVARRYGAGLRP